jgi:hypothetical protein
MASSPPVTPPSSPLVNHDNFGVHSNQQGMPSASPSILSRVNGGTPSQLTINELNTNNTNDLPETPPSSPLSPLEDTEPQHHGYDYQPPPATPPSPSSYSQPSISVSATQDNRSQFPDYSASIDATPMPRYLRRFAEGDINIDLPGRHLPRGDLGRSQFRLPELSNVTTARSTDTPGTASSNAVPEHMMNAGSPVSSPPSSPRSVHEPRRGLPHAPASPGSASMSMNPRLRGDGQPDDEPVPQETADANYHHHGQYNNAVIWGTNVSMSESIATFKAFVLEFQPQSHDAQGQGDDTSYYRKVLQQIALTQEGVFNLDCQHFLHFNRPATTKLYHQLVHFPQVLVRIFDMAIGEVFSELFPEDAKSVRTHIYI